MTKTLEAQVRTLHTPYDWMEWQRHQAGDMVTSAFGRIHALEAGDRARAGDARSQDGPADAGSSYISLLLSDNLVKNVLLRKSSEIAEDFDSLSFHHVYILSIEHEVLNLDSARMRVSNQSIRSSNAIALDSSYLLVLITGTSQSRQHESRKSPTKSLFDVGSRRISIVTVNTKEYHSDVLAIITRIMRRTY
ncbi:hypothetical protein Tco_0312761 [Tanacetum coccineum]